MPCHSKRSAPCSAGLTLILLCAALTSNAMPVHAPCRSEHRKLRRTSKEDGNATCSGMRHNTFALQTVLSSTSRGSLPSASTTFSLPIAVRLGHCCCASALLPGNFAIQPCLSSASMSSAMICGLSSALVQFPLQCRR